MVVNPRRIYVDWASVGWRGVSRLWSGRSFGWLEAAFLGLALLALGMRLWELGGRAMHYDEAIHLHFSWVLYNLEGFVHSPWMHGPFQIELTALMLGIFGDSDFTARLGYALFGAALVALPYFFRDYLGRMGALCVSVMLMLSPALLYFSRFGRNDIIMVFLAVALLVLMWRYVNENRDRYLYLASAVLAVLFATKETSYFVVLIFGGIMFALALPQLVPCALGRVRFDGLAGPAGFLLLLVTLTLPQWSSAVGVFQDQLWPGAGEPGPPYRAGGGQPRRYPGAGGRARLGRSDGYAAPGPPILVAAPGRPVIDDGGVVRADRQTFSGAAAVGPQDRCPPAVGYLGMAGHLSAHWLFVFGNYGVVAG